MTDAIKFILDGDEVEAAPGETIWQVAHRKGVEIPHLCYSPAPGYRPDGNCRACMVEIEGERVLAASCIRKPTPGMKVKTGSERARFSRQMVFELLVGDQPARATAHDPDSRLRSLRPIAAIRRWRSISMPASNARSASALAARCR
jgi:formate dehydrogenase major subunit